MASTLIATLDFKACSLEETGYPIEVAFVIGTASDIVMQFSTLIRPRAHWRGRNAWSVVSEQVHGIPQWHLANGTDADEICDILNRSLADKKVGGGGGSYDAFWMGRWFDGRPRTFELDHLTAFDSKAFIALKHAAEPRHRARPDAFWLWATITN